MFDERAYVDSVDQADPDTLADMLSHPSYAEEAALRKYLGDVRFQRLHGLALKLGLTQGDRKPTWNVVVIPGIMGSVLSTVGPDGVHEEVWLRTSAIFQGHLERLRVAADGRTNADRNYHVTPTGIMKRHYGEMLLMLM